ncbi:MAG: hypothetical protein QG668_17 [Patescibacteria group bacterium]|nr:hypothetical protein [Patescibacteria group bacterium]
MVYTCIDNKIDTGCVVGGGLGATASLDGCGEASFEEIGYYEAENDQDGCCAHGRSAGHAPEMDHSSCERLDHAIAPQRRLSD